MVRYTEQWLADRLRKGVGNVEPIKQLERTRAATLPSERMPIGIASGASSSPISLSLTLPWPPSGNTAVRHANGAHYLTREVKAYRETVANLCAIRGKLDGPYSLSVVLSPPDRRKRDSDNALKTILDSIKGRLVIDDSMDYMRELHVRVEGMRGDVQLTATAWMPEAA